MDLIPYVFSIEGVKVFLSEHLCQDPLEKIFGCQRQRGGTHDNPTVQEFYKNTQALRVVNSMCVGSIKGNCHGARDSTIDRKMHQRQRFSESNLHQVCESILAFQNTS